MNTVTLPASGAYTVLVGDCSDTNTGNYEIYAQRTDNPSGVPNLPFGQTQTATIGSTAQSNSTPSAPTPTTLSILPWSLQAAISARRSGFTIPMERCSASAYPSTGSGACSGGQNRRDEYGPLPASGTYTVLLGDCSRHEHRELRDLRAADEQSGRGRVPSLGSGTDRHDRVQRRRAIAYTFSGSANDVVDLTMVTTSGSLSPKIRLYNPDGTLLSIAYPSTGSGAC